MISPLDRLKDSAAETARLANAVMHSPGTTDADFSEAFRARDIAFVQSLGMDAEQMGEARWETQCGCNGDDSPYHSYFGFSR